LMSVALNRVQEKCVFKKPYAVPCKPGVVIRGRIIRKVDVF